MPSAEHMPALDRDVPVARPGEFRPLRLGALSVWPPVVLAPMAGVTNYPFRTLCRGYGAGLYVSEMITARGFLEGNHITRLLASSRPGERPRSVQLYGSNPSDLEETARILVAEGVEHLDLNFGCPVPKVTRHGGGSAIPVRPRLMARLVAATVHGAGAVPVTVKVRTGIDDRLLTFLDAGRVAESEGAAAIGLHARTAAQLYAGTADWEAIGALKGGVSIPVLGNGDVWECWDALRMLRTTGCDGVIVGRGCLRRPWLFAELAAVFDGREPAPQPRFGEIAGLMRRHAELLVDFFGPLNGIRQMRKWCAWYTTGFRNSAAVRGALVSIERIEEMLAIVARLVAAVRGAGAVPVTVKVRKGIDDRLLTFLDSGRVAESEGAAAIGLHARTAAQLYAGTADWGAIGALKNAVSIPVLGNGDVWECWDALRMLRTAGCDGVIVGRGCLRRPWLFAELAAVFDGREPAAQPRFGEIADLMRRHAELLVDFFGPTNGIRQMRKWCAWYTTGFRNSAAVRGALVSIESIEEMLAIVGRLDQEEPFPIATVRSNRVKDGRVQRRVQLPAGYLDRRDDDTPPSPPFDPQERAAFERALDGG